VQVDEPAVWSELGHAQLDHGLVAEAIASYLRSNDTSRSSDVLERSKEVSPDCSIHHLPHPLHALTSCMFDLVACCSLTRCSPISFLEHSDYIPASPTSPSPTSASGCIHTTATTGVHVLLLQAGSYEDLVKYLIMVRKKAKDSKVDTELVYAYAKTKQLGPLEEFISSPNQANLQVSCSSRLCSIWIAASSGSIAQCLPGTDIHTTYVRCILFKLLK